MDKKKSIEVLQFFTTGLSNVRLNSWTNSKHIILLMEKQTE